MQLQAATGNLRVKMVALLLQHFCVYQQFKVVEHNEAILRLPYFQNNTFLP